MEGVERLFERMVREHQHRVFAVGFALTGNRHDAEEVAQDTFLRAYRALATYPPERIRDLKQRPWLHRIAVNVVRNRARGAKPRTAELNGSESDNALGPESRALQRADAMLVIGSSLMVYSGYRFVRAMADLGKPIAAINLGRTRGDDLLRLKFTDRCTNALRLLAAA